MDAEQIHELACRAGAVVFGEPGSTHQYMLSAAELCKFLALATVPACPVPAPFDTKK